MIEITIKAPAKSGKTAVAQRIVEALRAAGAEVRVVDIDGDHERFARRPDSVLAGKQVVIDFLQAPRPFPAS